MKVVNQLSAGGIVYKKKRKSSPENEKLWLICQHSQHKGWVFPKGLVGDHNLNEAVEQAALREVQEEGGIDAKIVYPQPIITNYQFKWKDQLIKKTVHYFLMEYISGDPKDHDWEMTDAKFVNEDQVRKTLSYESDREAFGKVLELKI